MADRPLDVTSHVSHTSRYHIFIDCVCAGGSAVVKINSSMYRNSIVF